MTFPVKDFGEPEKIFGVRVTRDKKAGTWILDQTEYVDEVLKRYEMYECDSCSVPIDRSDDLKAEEFRKENLSRKFQSFPY